MHGHKMLSCTYDLYAFVQIQSGEKRNPSSKTQEVDNVEEAAGSESEGDESHQEDDKKPFKTSYMKQHKAIR